MESVSSPVMALLPPFQQKTLTCLFTWYIVMEHLLYIRIVDSEL